MYVGKTQLFISGLHTRSFLTSLSTILPKYSALTKFNTIVMPLVKFAQPEDNACVAFTGSIIFDYSIIVPNILTLYTIKREIYIYIAIYI